jgi:ABC-type uncharacterized transport system permease subunit
MKISIKQIIHQLLQDKDGNFSLREAIALIYVLMSIVAWVSQQFFGLQVPEYMFYSFMSMIAASAFGYSLEKKSNSKE